jgi:hypothetical protein
MLLDRFVTVWHWALHHRFWAVVIVIGAATLTELIVDFLSERLFHRRIGRHISKFLLVAISMALVVFTYFTVIALTALGFRATGRRLLPDARKAQSAPTYWTHREKTDPTLDYLRRQF